MSNEEIALVIRTVAEQAKKRVPVIAGAGTNNTAKSIALSKIAAECGADGLLIVAPYYNKPTQAGLIAHYRAISEAVKLPVVAYNVPGRTSSDILPETVAELAKLPGVAAIKEATASMIRASEVIAACRGQQFDVLSGDDFTCVPLTLLGGAGVVSVVSNLCPKETSAMIAAARRADVAEATRLHYKLFSLMKLLFIESNPIPVKAGVSLLGYTANDLRLPLLPLAAEKLALLEAEMKQQGVL
jgi:4-hydroxy-tetrahydrodipicolinate synthase